MKIRFWKMCICQYEYDNFTVYKNFLIRLLIVIFSYYILMIVIFSYYI